jgi:hypothetical protein
LWSTSAPSSTVFSSRPTPASMTSSMWGCSSPTAATRPGCTS